MTCSGFTYPNSSGLVTPPQFCNPRPITFNHARIVCKLSCNLYDPASPHQDLGKWQRTAFISKRACSSQAILQLNMSGSCAILRYLTHDEGMSRSSGEAYPTLRIILPLPPHHHQLFHPHPPHHQLFHHLPPHHHQLFHHRPPTYASYSPHVLPNYIS